LRWALERIEAEVAPFPCAKVVATMLRRDGRRPLSFQQGVMPPWLAHLREVNDVLVSLQTAPAVTVAWASSWNRPLPNVSYGVPLPQPDGVVVLAPGSGRADLLFIEHDRSSNSLNHFRRCVDRYRQLAQRPGLLAGLTGFRAFHVLVTVRAGDPPATAKRIADLEGCARVRLAGSLFTFASADSLCSAGAIAARTDAHRGVDC